jgi:hypothetical protein
MPPIIADRQLCPSESEGWQRVRLATRKGELDVGKERGIPATICTSSNGGDRPSSKEIWESCDDRGTRKIFRTTWPFERPLLSLRMRR